MGIEAMMVLPESSGHGIGAVLLSAVEAEAQRRGCCKLTLCDLRSMYARRKHSLRNRL